MVRVAIAGGTGNLGRTLVDAIVDRGGHDVFVTTRKQNRVFAAQPAVTLLVLDYDSVETIARTLSQHRVHTILSTLSGLTPDLAEAELNLIRGAAASGTVRRFAPAEFGYDFDQDDEHVPLTWKPERRRAIAEIKKHPQLEYTLFQPGFFMDYLGMPHVASYFPPEACFLDIPHHKAVIPGSGDDLIAFTYSKDAAKLVARSLDLPSWPERSLMIGDRASYKGLIAILERVRGVKFDIVHDSLTAMRAGRITELPSYQAMYDYFPKDLILRAWANFGVAMATGSCDLRGDTLNAKFPDVEMRTLAEFIAASWSGK